MTNLVRQQDTPRFQFCDDFGNDALLLAHFTRDRSVIGVAGLVGGFVGMAIGGFPLVALVGFATINDLINAGKQPKNQTQQPSQDSEHQGAITVQPKPLISPESPPPAVAPSSGVSRVLSPLDRLLASPYQSRAIFGAQRTGKSYLAAIATQQMSLKGTKVFHVNLHSYGDEDARYWTHAQSVQGDMGHLPEDEVLDLTARAIKLVRDFTATRDAILVVDEITLTGATANPYAESLEPLLKAIASICSELASTGKKRQQAIWTLSPDFVAGMLTQPTKAIKSLAVTFVAIPPGRSVDWQGQAIGFHAESFANIQRNYPALTDAPAMNCERMVFVDGLWLDMGTLPNLLAAPPPTATKQPSDRSAPVTVEIEASVIKESADYSEWQDYPIHQAVLQYLHGKQGKTTRDIYNTIRQKLPSEVWQSVPGSDNMTRTRKAVQWLAGKGLIEDSIDGTFAGSTTR